ncbi:hypothetical protein [Methylomonas sp. HYX-M1]|uniref:hypothetical protein n=1 Tax=Methylomonas sp. HYX-M1 TaxID=3139307 RepID=UPI00345C4395
MEPAQDNMAESAAAWGTNEIMLMVAVALAVLIAAVVYALKKKDAGRTELRAAPEPTAQPEIAPVPAVSTPAVEPASVPEISLASTVEAEPQAELTTSPARAETVATEPEDSVLHRHYEAEQTAKHDAQTNPYPTDSVLRRHYDSAHKLVPDPAPASVVEAVVTEPAVEPPATLIEKAVAQAFAEPAPSSDSSEVAPAAETPAAVPEDSILHRHYEAEQAAKREVQINPYPTDSVLRRHFDAAHKLASEPASSAVVNDAALEVVAPAAVAAQQPGAEEIKTVRIPQDSVLRRHFISQLKYQIEAELPPIPSDSVLRRHHEALLNAELSKRLSA